MSFYSVRESGDSIRATTYTKPQASRSRPRPVTVPQEDEIIIRQNPRDTERSYHRDSNYEDERYYSRDRERTTAARHDHYEEDYTTREKHVEFEPSVDGDTASEGYDFELSFMAKRPGSVDLSIDSRSISSASMAKEASQDIHKQASEHKSLRNITWSQYLGQISDPEDVVAELTVSQGTGGFAGNARNTVFQWIHLDNPVMSFDAFVNTAIQYAPHPGAESEKINLPAIFNRIRKQFEKPWRPPQGTNGRYMEPFFFQETVSSNSKSKSRRTRATTVMSLPYFSLEKYAYQKVGDKSTSHPVRTLLQSHIPSVGRERDINQAASKLPNVPEEFCFHVPQLWCLVIDGDLLITAARLPFKKFLDESIKVMTKPVIDSQSISTPDSRSVLQIDNDGCCLWFLPLEDCETWFSFTSNFIEHTIIFDDTFDVLYKDHPIGPHNWSKVIDQARKSSMRLFLARKKRPKGLPSETEARDVVYRVDRSDSPGHTRTFSRTERPRSGSPKRPEEQEGSELPEDSAANREQTPNFDPRSQPPETLQSEAPAAKPTPTPDQNAKQVAATAAILRDTEPASASKISTSKPTDLHDFHVFTWLATVSKHSSNSGSSEQNSYHVDVSLFKESLNQVHNYLWNNPQSRELVAYRTLQERSIKAIEDLNLGKLDEKNMRQTYVTDIEFPKAAKAMIQIFMPLDTEAPVASKYWGAVYHIIITASQSPKSRQQLMQPLARFIQVSQVMEKLHGQFSNGKAPRPWQMQLPEAFVRAWLHCVMSLVVCTTFQPTSSDSYRHISLCGKLLYQGTEELMKGLHSTSLDEKQAVLPMGIMSLVIRRVLQDVTGDMRDLSDTYWDYIKILESEIENDQLNRVHQGKISALRKEIGAVLAVLDGQERVLIDFNDSLRRRRYENANLSKAWESGCESQVSEDCLQIVHDRKLSFRALDDWVSDLADSNLRMIDSNKDRQEAAIYAFTIVTIIFLPLSFVSGFLGMNTSDMRTMSQKQWVFWAVAIPLTLIIVIISLLWAGELKNAWDALAKLFPQRKQPGYQRLQGGQEDIRLAPRRLREPEVIRDFFPYERSRTIRPSGGLVRRSTLDFPPPPPPPRQRTYTRYD